MSRLNSHAAALFAAAVMAAAVALPGGEAAPFGKKLNVLILDGGHGPFPPRFFENTADFTCTIVSEKTGGEAFEDIGAWAYDVILMYNYQRKLTDKQAENFLKLTDKGVGLVILHHAIYGYRPWPEFKNVVACASWLSGAKDNVDLKIHVEDPAHPITQGLADFQVNDEGYAGYTLDPKARVLLTTDSPENAKSIAWVHTYRKSPVCYFQLGHGPKAFACKEFRTVLERAVRWVAGRLPETGKGEPAKP